MRTPKSMIPLTSKLEREDNTITSRKLNTWRKFKNARFTSRLAVAVERVQRSMELPLMVRIRKGLL